MRNVLLRLDLAVGEGASMVAKSIQKMFAVVVLSLTMVSTGMAAERAASIEYETVAKETKGTFYFSSE